MATGMTSVLSDEGASTAVCAVCHTNNCDLQLIGCGCTLHVECTPLSLIFDPSTAGARYDGVSGGFLPAGPRETSCTSCPVCPQGSVTGIKVFPMTFAPLMKAVELRKQAVLVSSDSKSESAGNSSKSSGANTTAENVTGGKREREDSEELQVEAAHVVFSQGKQAVSSNLPDSESQRTGRWTDAEVKCVDRLVAGFDNGELPIPQGTKLASFLGDILCCKSSRLTKKMKNAKLSTRTYDLQKSTILRSINSEDHRMLRSLQKDFIKILPTEYQQIEMDFNITKQWRTFFSNLCVQIGYPFLDGSSFIASLEEYEQIAANAEEKMRNIKRRRMGFNLRKESQSSPMNSSIGGTSDDLNKIRSSSFTLGHSTRNDIMDAPAKERVGLEKDNTLPTGADDVPEADELHDFMKMINEGGHEDEDPLASGSFGIFPPVAKSRDPFLEAIAMYLEKYNLPYQHADVWVPSFVGEDSGEDVQLLHAGHVTRRDQDGQLWSSFENFGEYFKSFSFKPGTGLVGRVYSTGKTLWEFQVSELDPKRFLRAGGAKEYGIRTATGIPFSTPGVGRMVVVLYSCNHIKEDAALAHQCAEELSRYSPEPKWKLVIEIGDNFASTITGRNSQGQTMDAQSSMIDHYEHGRTTPAVGPVATTAQVTPGSREASEEVDIRDIISLLGDQLATQTVGDVSDDEGASLFHEFMSIRLMLLQPATRRSIQENEMIDVLKNSYKAYSAGNRRSGSELATLLAREWLCLSGAHGKSKSMSPTVLPQLSSPHQIHEMAPALLSTTVLETNSIGMIGPPVKLGSTYPASMIDQAMVIHDHSSRHTIPTTTIQSFNHSPSFDATRQALPRTVSCSIVPPGELDSKGRSNSFGTTG